MHCCSNELIQLYSILLDLSSGSWEKMQKRTASFHCAALLYAVFETDGQQPTSLALCFPGCCRGRPAPCALIHHALIMHLSSPGPKTPAREEPKGILRSSGPFHSGCLQNHRRKKAAPISALAGNRTRGRQPPADHPKPMHRMEATGIPSTSYETAKSRTFFIADQYHIRPFRSSLTPNG